MVEEALDGFRSFQVLVITRGKTASIFIVLASNIAPFGEGLRFVV